MGHSDLNWLLTIATIFALILAILWILLPFAVFGIKRRIDHQAQLSYEILSELRGLRGDIKEQSNRSAPNRNDRPQ